MVIGTVPEVPPGNVSVPVGEKPAETAAASHVRLYVVGLPVTEE